ncbi:Permease [Lactococcus lactis subsp. lactis NCDO 2118]|uniref:Permease n=2 Tax=Lactococcus lactis TaxID=1358 RepID=A0ABC8A6H4_LACLL|nr:MFS transporter [Lactococcus lactis]AII12729.1 Permease [Lactococcus lactis subsp. lactis NCDO 2118]
MKYLQNLKNKHIPLMMCPFVSQLGLSVYLIGLNWLIVEATGTTKQLGIIQAVSGVAFIITDVFVGVLVDKYNPKVLILLTNLLSALVNFGGAILVNSNHPQTLLLIVTTFSLNIMLAINYPSVKALVPSVIKSNKIQRFNAISNTIYGFASILAPLICSILLCLGKLSFNQFLLVNGLLFLFAALINNRIESSKSYSINISGKFIENLIEGFQYIRRTRKLILLISAMGIFNLCYSGFILLIPYLAKNYFQSNVNIYSIALLLMSLGGLAGGVNLARQTKSINSSKIYLELVIFSLILLGVVSYFNQYTWLGMVAVFGFVQAQLFGSIPTFIQKETDSKYLGRVFGLAFLAFDGAQPLGSLFFSNFIDSISYKTYIGISIIMFISFLVIFTFDIKYKTSD